MLVRRWASASAIALLMIAGSAQSKSQQCSSSPSDAAAIDRTVRSFFDALVRDDAAAVGRATTQSFYAFDAGKRFTAGELVALVRGVHAKGVKLNWNLGPIDMHIGCDMAWTAWENRGSAGVPPEVTPVTWLESAVLKRTGAGWQIDFFHSSRVTPPKTTGQ